MPDIESFRDLIAWQKSMDVAEAIHKVTESFSSGDRYTLGAQMRKSSQSVPSNIAEGFHRHARRAYRNHVAIACGSTAELQTQLELSRRLNLISADLVARLQSLADEVARLVFGLWKSLSPVVCYPVTLLVVIFGLRPLAFGLFHGFTKHS